MRVGFVSPLDVPLWGIRLLGCGMPDRIGIPLFGRGICDILNFEKPKPKTLANW